MSLPCPSETTGRYDQNTGQPSDFQNCDPSRMTAVWSNEVDEGEHGAFDFGHRQERS